MILRVHHLVQTLRPAGIIRKSLAPRDMDILLIPRGVLARITGLNTTTCTTHLTQVKRP